MRLRLAAVGATLLLAGCGTNEDVPTPPAVDSLSIQDALESDGDGPLMVRGYLIDRDGELRLCETILESHPPQCGEPSLGVEGDAPAASEERVSLLGEVEDGTITVSEPATG